MQYQVIVSGVVVCCWFVVLFLVVVGGAVVVVLVIFVLHVHVSFSPRLNPSFQAFPAHELF